MTPTLRVGSLFTGYCGLDMAVRLVLGGELAWVSDNHPSAQKLLAHHHPGVPNLGDITAIDWHQVEPVDVLAAGFPCQDISNAGQRAGIEGKRSGLWSHVADAIGVLRPRLVVLENVSALVVRGLDRVLADLAALGFDAEWTTLRASDIGAPHRRERWFLIAWPAADPAGDGRDEGWTEPARLLWGPDAALGGHPAGHATVLGRDAAPAPERSGEPARTPGGPGVAAAHPDSTGLEGREPARGHELPARSTVADAHAGGLGADQHDVRAGQPDADRSPAADADRDGLREQPVGESGRGGAPVAVVAGTDGTAPHTDGDGQQQREGDQLDLAGRVGDGGTVNWGDYGPAVHRWESVLGRPAPAPTVLSDRYLKMLRLRLERRHPKPVGMRGSLAKQSVLNAVFVEWLMGLPAGHVTNVPGLSRNDQLRLLGNGVVPQQGAAALRFLLAAHLAEVAA